MGAGLVPAVLVMGVLSGCSSDPEPDRPTGAAKSQAKDGAKSAAKTGTPAAAKGGTVGGAGSPCALPVSFDLAAGWKPQAVKDDTEFGLTRQGPVTLVCEIDAKPTGNIGFLRIWTGGRSGDDPRKALEAFVAEEAKDRDKVAYAGTKAGEYAATEVTYLNTNEFLDAPKKERAFAFTTPKGVVVVHLGGLDNEEHEGMLPAYELAKKSVRGA
ncbi:lipoprotein [Streptomyces sp. ISL-1]|uniref:lipoprotein n=1 Tax=Streptomyces sp. ISL-1 TaxID=2817657 RepID=UPI0027E3BFED|nr:lipoprotein [Streptomyces sp. ISL-1]